MTPDEQHEQYYKGKPPNYHEKMSDETRLTIEYLQKDIKVIKNAVEPLQKMKFTQDLILAQVKKTNGRVDKLDAWKDKNAPGIKVLLKDKEAQRIWIREHIWKLIGIAATSALAGGKIKDFIL